MINTEMVPTTLFANSAGFVSPAVTVEPQAAAKKFGRNSVSIKPFLLTGSIQNRLFCRPWE
jgi:hypothetical protein